LQTLKDLKENSKNVKVKVKVLEKNKERNVKVKKNNSIHRVANFIISDETNTFYLTVWDDEIDKIPIKETIIINNGYVSQFAGELYLNIGRFGSWIIADSKMTKVQNQKIDNTPKKMIGNNYKKIENLLPSQRNLKLIGKIIEISEVRKVKIKRDNTEHEVADFLIADDTGCIILALWDDWITKITGYNIIELKNAYVTEYKGGMRLNLSKNGSIEEFDEPTEVFFSDINVENNLSMIEPIF